MSLRSQSRELVLALLPPLIDDPTTLKQVTEHIAKEVKLDVQGGSRKTWQDVEAGIGGLARTARVRVHSDLADGLEAALSQLHEHRKKGEAVFEDDMPVKMSNIPQHVQLLLALADKPSSSTHSFAQSYLNRLEASKLPQGLTADQMLFREIMAEPFQGDHWKTNLDHEQRHYLANDKDWSDEDSVEDVRSDYDSESGVDEMIVTPHKTQRMGKEGYLLDELDQARVDAERRLHDAERRLKDFQDCRYWEKGGEVVHRYQGDLQGWKAVSTSVSALSLAHTLSSDRTSIKAINSTQLQRELFFALCGKPGVMFTFGQDGECTIIDGHPQVQQYSPSSLNGILNTFSFRASQLARLRGLTTDSIHWSISSSLKQAPSKTKQAFAEACRGYLQKVDEWLAELEFSFVRGRQDDLDESTHQSCVTPIGLQLKMDSRFGTVLDVLHEIFRFVDDPYDLLDALCTSMSNSNVSSSADDGILSSIFIVTASPIWNLLGSWLHSGMPIPNALLSQDPGTVTSSTLCDDERQLDAEFMIKRDRDVSWADEDFREAAFILKLPKWPEWLGGNSLGDLVVEAGKARGLLKSLGHLDTATDNWRSLNDVLVDVNSSSISETIIAYLTPICQMTMFHLRQSLEHDCGLIQHLEAIDGVLFMRGQSVLYEWAEGLFERIFKSEQWTDFQILTSSLREIVDEKGEYWMNPTAIRIRTVSKSPQQISPGMLSIVQASYQVPFPLSQLFTSTSLDLRADVFTFLLQVMFARYLIRSCGVQNQYPSGIIEDNDVHRMRWLKHRLNWVIDAIWTWVTERVIETQAEKHKKTLQSMSSLKDMIQLELAHTRRMRDFCFQHQKTSNINDAVSSIIQLAAELYHLTSLLSTADNGIATKLTDKSRTSSGQSTPRLGNVQLRSRCRRRLVKSRKQWNLEESDTDDDHACLEIQLRAEQQQEHLAAKGISEGSSTMPKEKIEKMVMDLEKYVTVLKDGVEELALGEDTSSRRIEKESQEEGKEVLKEGHGEQEVREIWGMLEFALQDWR